MRVLIVDDHPLFRDGIASLLTVSGYDVVGQIGDGETAVAQAAALKPDIIMLDIRMPGINGIETLRQIKAQLPQVKIVMLTASESDSHIMEAVKAGASGYILKSANADELLANLHRLERGELAMSPYAASMVIQQLVQPDLPEKVTQPEDLVEQLTPRETEILGLVVEGLPNKAIAVELNVSENTVKYHLKKVLQKLQVQNRTEAATWAIRAGLFSQKNE